MFEFFSIVGMSLFGAAILDVFGDGSGNDEKDPDYSEHQNGAPTRLTTSLDMEPLHISIDQIEWSGEASIRDAEDNGGPASDKYVHLVDDPSKSEIINLSGATHAIVNSSSGDHVIEGENNALEDRMFISVSNGGAIIEGGNSDGEFYSNGPNDTVFAAGGDDFIVSGDDPATIYGGDGNDTLFASYENIFGSGAIDEDNEFVDEVSDSLDGGAGNDTIYGSGKDIIATGDGFDTINLFGTNNIIDDFDPEMDQLRVFLPDGADDILETGDLLVSNDEGDLTIRYNDINMVTLRNVGKISIVIDNGGKDDFIDLVDGTEVFNPKVIICNSF